MKTVKQFLAIALICSLCFLPCAVQANQIEIGKNIDGSPLTINNGCTYPPKFPMGPGGGRSSNVGLNPLVQKLRRANQAVNQAKQTAEATGQSITAQNNQSFDFLDNCLVSLDFKIFTMPNLEAILDGIVSYFLTELCNYVKKELMGLTGKALSAYNNLGVTLPYLGKIGASDVVSITASPGGGNLSLKPVNNKDDTLSNAAGNTAANANQIIQTVKPGTFSERLKSGKK